MWIIIGKYQNGTWEELDSFDTLKEARQNLREYIMSYGSRWTIDLKRGKK